MSVDGHAIERMGEIKLLGVQIDEKLKNCRGPSAAKLSLYKSSILLHLTYCYLVWHFCNTSDRRKLERIQERAGAGASAKSDVQNQISFLSRTARPRQTTDVAQSASSRHCHFNV